jgi:hypothetical protein
MVIQRLFRCSPDHVAHSKKEEQLDHLESVYNLMVPLYYSISQVCGSRLLLRVP